MQKIIVPRPLYCPFSPAINSNVVEAEARACNFLRQFKLVNSEADVDYYRRQGFAYMVSRMFPDAEPESLFAFTDLNTLLFLMDDGLDHQGDVQVESLGSVQSFVEGFQNVLLEGPESKIPEYRALADIWRRIKALSTPHWQARFRKSFKAIFDAALWQKKNVVLGLRPEINTYMKVRQYLGAANIATDTIEVTSKLDLSQEILEHPVVKQLTELTRNAVCWANDVFSLSKEEGHGDDYNLVLIFEKQEKLSREEAILKVLDIHDRDVLKFISLAGNLPDIGSQLPELKRYVRALSRIMRANLDWSFQETDRYAFEYCAVPEYVNAV